MKDLSPFDSAPVEARPRRDWQGWHIEIYDM